MSAAEFSGLSHLTEDRMEKALASPQLAELADPDLRELQLAQEAQSRYMSFLSHDLRGSLNGLVLMVEVLKREIEAKKGNMDEVLSDLAMMKRALVDTVGMMERHVLADRLRKGRAEIKREPVKLADIVQEAISKAYPAARARPNFEVDVPADAIINSDKELLRIAIHELVDNLAKHCGPCKSRVSAQKTDGNWIIEVSDDGPGIPPDRLEQMMDGVKRGQMRERGLGLMLAQLIARAIGGRFDASSEEGQGTRFQLVIPSGD
jgi:signal transduction histidine kinase